MNVNTRSQNILAICLILTSVFFFCTASYIVGIPDYVTYRRLDILDCFVTPFIIPLMYLYFRSLTHDGKFTWTDYIWFLPAFAIGIGTFVLYMAMDETEAMDYINTVLINKLIDLNYRAPLYKLHYMISIKLYTLFALIQIIGTVLCAIIYLKRYHLQIREFHSALYDKSIDDNNRILIWFIVVVPFAFGIILTKETFWSEHPVITSLFFIGYSAVYFGIFHYAIKNRYTVANLAAELEKADFEAALNHYDSTGGDSLEENAQYLEVLNPKNKNARYFTSFSNLIEHEKLFLQSNLRADEVASRICTNRTYLSRMIKEEFGCTFSDYINRKRIEHSQILMRDNPNIRISELAEQSGFTNINSFGRTFKQIMGVPPKEWFRKNILDC